MGPGWPSPRCPQQVGDRLRQQLQPRAGHNSGAQCSSPHPSAPQAPYCPSQGLPALPQKHGDKHAPPECCSPKLCTGLVPRGDRRVHAVLPSATPEFRFLFLFPLCRHTSPSLEQKQLRRTSRAQTLHPQSAIGTCHPTPTLRDHRPLQHPGRAGLQAAERSPAPGTRACRQVYSSIRLLSTALHPGITTPQTPKLHTTPPQQLPNHSAPATSPAATNSSPSHPEATRCSNTNLQQTHLTRTKTRCHSHPPREKGMLTASSLTYLMPALPLVTADPGCPRVLSRRPNHT